MQLTPDIQKMRAGLSRQYQKIFDAMVSLAEKVNPSFENKMQWQTPTFTLNGNWHHWIFSLGKTKTGVTVTFHKGWLLDDPQKMLTGDGKHLRMLRFTDVVQIQKDAVKQLIREAVCHQLDL